LEMYPGTAMDRAEIMEVGARIETPAGTFLECLVITESSPLEPDDESYKRYAPGVGMIFDDGLELLRHGNRRRSEKVIEFEIRESDVPRVAADVVRELRPGGEMREVKVELHRDRVVYAVETFVEGHQYDVEVTEDGEVLRNERD
ncbi:hypothetical protein K8I85_18455, partial [bacterium]|nr:hypothetical protein [bacterium]